MSSERKWPAYGTASLTVDADNNGRMSVANTFGLYVKMLVSLKSNTAPQIDLEVKEILSQTEIRLGPVGTSINDFSKLSAYLVSDSASISGAAQPMRQIDPKDIENATYAREPIVAKRSIAVDKYGNFYDTNNPLPITITSGVELEFKNDSGNPLPVSVDSLPLPTGASTSDNQTNGDQKTQIVDGAGNVISSTGNALDVNIKTPITVDVSLSNTNDDVLVYGFDGTSNKKIKVASDGSISINDGGNSITVDAISLPLPTGAATDTLQTTGNSSLSSIDTKLSSQATAAKQDLLLAELQLKADLTETQPVSIAGTVAVTGPLTDAQLRASPVPVTGVITYKDLINLIINSNFLKLGNFDQIIPTFAGNLTTLSYYESLAKIGVVKLRFVSITDWDINLEAYINNDDGVLLEDDNSNPLFLE